MKISYSSIAKFFDPTKTIPIFDGRIGSIKNPTKPRSHTLIIETVYKDKRIRLRFIVRTHEMLMLDGVKTFTFKISIDYIEFEETYTYKDYKPFITPTEVNEERAFKFMTWTDKLYNKLIYIQQYEDRNDFFAEAMLKEKVNEQK